MARLSDEKVVHLSHVLLQRIQKLPGISFPRGANAARLRMLALVQEAARAEDELHERIRKKIASMRRDIPEGGSEWEVLFRRYYDEEMVRIAPPASGR